MKRFLLVTLLLLCTSINVFALDSKELALSDDDKHKITLEQATDLALEGNIELQEQRKNLGISKNDIRSANALKNPMFQSNILVGRIGKANSSQIGLTLPIEITKRGTRKKVSEAGLMYTENKIKDYEFKLKLNIRSSYFNLLVAKSNLKIMEDRKALLEDLLEIAKNKPHNSESYEIDVLQADMRLKKQLIEINRAKANVRTEQYKFNRVLNLENNLTLFDTQEDSLFEQSLFISKINIPDYESLEAAAFNNRKDIKMVEARVIKTERNIKLALKHRVPDLYLSGGYAFAHDGTPGAFIGAGFEIPSLYLYDPEIKNAKIEYEKAKLEYNSIINVTKNIVHKNHDKFIIAQENVSHYQEILDASEEVMKISKMRYQKGKVPLTSLIVAEQSHQTILNEYITAIGVYFNSYLDLLQTIGVEQLGDVL